MKILLNVKPLCTEIYAWSNNPEETFTGFDTKGKKFRATIVKFWHNVSTCGLTNAYQLPTVHDNDHFVAFDSSVPFNSFCEQLAHSKFNDPCNYSLLRHNCAHGATHALKVAGIPIDAPSFLVYNRIDYHSLINYFPGFSFSPLDLMERAKSLKIAALKCQQSPESNKSSAEFKYKLAKSSLFFWSRKSANTKIQNTVNIIATELDERSKQQPEHQPNHLSTLIATLNLLLQQPTEKEIDHYCLNAWYYHRRPEKDSSKILNNLVILFVIASLLEMGIRYNEVSKPYYYSFAAVNAALNVYFVRQLFPSFLIRPPATETTLSSNMLELAKLR